MTTPDLQSPFYHEEQHASLASVRATPITVCGVGSLGGPLAESLARMGFARLRFLDRDRVEARNLGAQPFGTADVGAPKARVLATALYRAVRAQVEPVVVDLTGENANRLLSASALVVDAFDNAPARAAVSSWARETGTPCLHLGFSTDGRYGCGLWEPDYQTPTGAGDAGSEEGPCDYPLTRPFAQVLAALACRAICVFLLEGVCEDVELTWDDVAITRRRRTP